MDNILKNLYEKLPEVQQLIIDCLATKWNRKSNAYPDDPCPFCFKFNKNCDSCSCPSYICGGDDDWEGNLFTFLSSVEEREYKIKELSPRVYRKAISYFTRALEGW